MSPRPPADGVVAARSLPRRFRGLFAGLDDDESPDALAARIVGDGTSAIGHLVAAARALEHGSRSLEAILTTEGAAVDRADGDATAHPTGTVEERLAELGREAEALADRSEHLGADDWARRGTSTGSGPEISAADVLWLAVDAAVAHLKGAERALEEARRLP